MPNLFVSLTTTPDRIGNIKPVLESILAGDLLPTNIVLNIPEVFKRTNSEYIIPDWLTNYDGRVSINRCVDMGPITKLLPTLSIVQNDEDSIVTIDDDIIYPTSFLSELIHAAGDSTTTTYAYSGFNLINSRFQYVEQNNSSCDVIEGIGGILYKKSFFPESFQDYLYSVLDCNHCYYSDDIVISNYLASQDINRILVNNDACSKDLILNNKNLLSHGYDKRALHCAGSFDTAIEYMNVRYLKCLTELKNKDMLFLTNKISTGINRLQQRISNVISNYTVFSNFIIYGFNDYGRALARAISDQDCKVISFLDQAYKEEQIEFNDIPIVDISHFDFNQISDDYVVILATDYHVSSMLLCLQKAGVSEDKIVVL